jgi:serine/threonine protein kinase
MDEVISLGLCLLDTLDAIHRAGIVHRDIKPGNVYICEDGRVVLTDFGIARIVDHDCQHADTIFVGSPAYSSPEQLRGDAQDPASDLYSLGATLYAAIEGNAPFGNDDIFVTVRSIVDDAPAPFRRAGQLSPVIAGMLLKEPVRRLTTCQAREALLRIQRGRLSA